MPRIWSVVAVSLAVPGLVACDVGVAGSAINLSFGRQADRFEWSGAVAPGGQVEIKGINGSIVAEPSSTDRVTLTAERRGVLSDPEDVRIEVVEHARGVTICAVYPGDGHACRPGDEGRIGARRTDVHVAFRVGVPDGVGFVARHVNGAIRAEGLTDNVDVTTVNGGVDVSTGGHARATTVNGSIEAAFGRADWTGEAVLETVNGSVTVTLPETIDAELTVRAVNGSIRSELPLRDVDSGRRRLTGRLGAGGRLLRIETTNGSVRLQPPS